MAATLAEVVKADGLPPDIEFRKQPAQSRSRLDPPPRRRDGDLLCRQPGKRAGRRRGRLPHRRQAAGVVGRRDRRDPRPDRVARRRTDARWCRWPSRRVRAGSSSSASRRRPPSSRGPANFPELQPLAEIAGPWQVSFDPKWGGPEQVAFDKLDDWSNGPRRASSTTPARPPTRRPSTSRKPVTRTRDRDSTWTLAPSRTSPA